MAERSDNPGQYLKGYRFGEPGGADPAEAAAKSPRNSIRSAVRRIGAMDDETLAHYCKEGKLSQSQKLALKKFSLAIKDGDIRAMQQLEESIDGKLVETKVEVVADSYAALVLEAAQLDGKEPSDN